MMLREFITLLGAAALGGHRFARVLLVGLLSAATLIGYSEASKKPIHIGVISFAEPGLRTHLDQSLIQGLREKGYVEGAILLSSGATLTATATAFRRWPRISPE